MTSPMRTCLSLDCWRNSPGPQDPQQSLLEDWSITSWSLIESDLRGCILAPFASSIDEKKRQNSQYGFEPHGAETS